MLAISFLQLLLSRKSSLSIGSLYDFLSPNCWFFMSTSTLAIVFRKFRGTIDRSSLTITVDDVALKQVDSAKYLGVIFDHNLNFL